MATQVSAALPPPIHLSHSSSSPLSSSSSLFHGTVADISAEVRAQTSRRVTGDHSTTVSSRGSSRPSSTLDVVPENHQSQPSRGPPPSSYRRSDGAAPSKSNRRVVSEPSQAARVEMDASMLRGKRSPEERKERAQTPPQIDGGGPGRFGESRPRKAQWIVDLLETQSGAEAWMDGHRIVLILGSVTPEALAPLLYNPTFSSTLLLIGSHEPLPAIEALLSPSHLMSSSPDRTIYPTIQPFTLKAKTNDTAAHSLTVLLAQATTLAQQSRSRSRSRSSPNLALPSRSRHSSFGSTASNSPPGTPPIRRRVLSSFGLDATSRRGSVDSVASDNSLTRPDSPKVSSDSSLTSTNDITPRPSRARLASGSRDSIMGSLLKLSEANDAKVTHPSTGSLFDAVVNFIPPMSGSEPHKALQDMLHEAVVVTTGVTPSLSRQGGKSSYASTNPDLPISLVHVLPQSLPAPLPSVIESFLLSLLPTFQGRGSREIFGCVVTTPAWLSPFVDVGRPSQTPEEDSSGAETLLFGGVRCPYQVLDGKGTSGDFRPRAFLPNWSSCLSMPGLVAESRKTGNVTVRQRTPSSSPSIAYSDVKARSPPQAGYDMVPTPLEQSIPPPPRQSQSMPRSMSMPLGVQRRSKLSSHVASASDLSHSPTTPELEPSISSCSSSFAMGETGSQGSASGSGSAGVVSVVSRRGSENGEVKGIEAGLRGVVDGAEKKKGLTSWFKSRRRSLKG
ncbi:hypothetical protein IAR55_006942 [Kwoniella newhampshirensis]|uniref:Uncharacterized protein n=1 Tax=Kwoniella newhampshirensis TaxID=1651941 RepID=A0AAW0YU03_9TREE